MIGRPGIQVDGNIINLSLYKFPSFSSGHYDGCWVEENTGWHAVSTVGYDQYSWEVKNPGGPTGETRGTFTLNAAGASVI